MEINVLCLLIEKGARPRVYLGRKKRGFGLDKHVGVGGSVELRTCHRRLPVGETACKPPWSSSVSE